jgi:transposase
LTTARHDLRALLTRHRPEVVVFETCTLAGWVSDLCEELGIPCKVANTTSEVWKFKHTNRKTDRDDALRLAQLETLSQLPTVSVPPIQTRRWRAWIAHRQRLVGPRVSGQNRIRGLLVAEGPNEWGVRRVRIPGAARQARKRRSPI